MTSFQRLIAYQLVEDPKAYFFDTNSIGAVFIQLKLIF